MDLLDAFLILALKANLDFDEKTIQRIIKNNVNTNNSNKPVKQTKKRKLWTDDETKKLIVGFYRHGKNQWATIHLKMGFGIERTRTDLKDKWRNLLSLGIPRSTSFQMKNVARFVDKLTNKLDNELLETCDIDTAFEILEQESKQQGDSEVVKIVQLIDDDQIDYQDFDFN